MEIRQGQIEEKKEDKQKSVDGDPHSGFLSEELICNADVESCTVLQVIKDDLLMKKFSCVQL